MFLMSIWWAVMEGGESGFLDSVDPIVWMSAMNESTWTILSEAKLALFAIEP